MKRKQLFVEAYNVERKIAVPVSFDLPVNTHYHSD